MRRYALFGLFLLYSIPVLGMQQTQASGSKFYVHAPVDEYWNSRFGAVVIEAIPRVEKMDLKVLLPQGFRRKWPAVSQMLGGWVAVSHMSGDWVECDGPARKLSYKEYYRLIHRLIPEIPFPIFFCKDYCENVGRMLEFCKACHPRLGECSPARVLPKDILKKIFFEHVLVSEKQ